MAFISGLKSCKSCATKKIDKVIAISVEIFQYGYIMKLNVDVYLQLSSFALCSILQKQLNNWNSEKVCLTV